MPTAARAARSEQTAQAPPPRRVACDPDRPVAITRDPDRDIALEDDEQKVLKAILSLAYDDPRMPGHRRWCCWAFNDTILGVVNTMGETKGHSYFDRAFKRLKEKGRLISKNMTDFRRWLIEQAPRHGMSCDPPHLLMKGRGRVIIIVAELPPVVSEAYGPLEIPPPADDPEHLDMRSSPPQSEEPELLTLRSSNRGTIPMDLPEYGTNSSSTCVCEPEGADDDEMMGSRDGEDLLSEQLREWLRRPEGDWQRRMAESALRMARDARDGRRQDAPRPTTWVESVAAGRERDPLPSAKPSAGDGASLAGDSPAGRIGRQTADRLAAAVRDLKPGDHDGAERVASGLISALDAEHDDDLVSLVRETIGPAAGGGMADAVAEAIREVPNGHNPRGLLISKLRKLRAGKNPPPGQLAKVPPAAGRKPPIMNPEPHCKVAR